MNGIVSGSELTAEQAAKFVKYREMLIEWNGVMNLTAITDPDEIALKHFADSLTLLGFTDRLGAADLIDVGTGAGFPGIPLKIMRPGLRVVLVDSLEKRVRFLNAVIGELGLEGIDAVHARAEDAGRDPEYREKFDVATARAVAPMNVLCEYCLPFVRTGGSFIAMKGPAEENFDGALRKLNGKVTEDVSFVLGAGEKGGAAPERTAENVTETESLRRRIIVIGKTAPSPRQYPRKAGLPAKKPLA